MNAAHSSQYGTGSSPTTILRQSLLTLRVEKEECPQVLDYIQQNGMVGITVDLVEEAVNELLGEDRLIEP